MIEKNRVDDDDGDDEICVNWLRKEKYKNADKMNWNKNISHFVDWSGQDGTLKSFSMVHDKHNKDLGVAAYDKAPGKKKDSKKGWKHMRPITCFAAGKVNGQSMTW